MNTLKIFNDYATLGYKVLPLHFGTKRPVFKMWNKKYSFEKTKNFLSANDSNFNFGILLGDVIDVEGDSAEANDFLDDLLSGISHPVYESSKSKHHLFRNKNRKITRAIYGNIEYRAYNHQSVIPPSIHEDGTTYNWLTKVFPVKSIPFLPDTIENELKKYKCNSRQVLKPTSKKIFCFKCKKQKFINKRRLELEIECLHQIQQKWMCHDCRPYDLRESCRKLKAANSKYLV